MEQNVAKKLKGALGADYNTLIVNFKAAAFATSERTMRAKWARVMEVNDCACQKHYALPQCCCAMEVMS
jgi:hypothetical protein